MVNRPGISTSSNYRQQPSTIIPRRGGISSYANARGGNGNANHQIRRNLPPPPRLYPRSEYPSSASSKRVTFRHSNDYNSGDEFDEDEDNDSLEGDLHQSMIRRNKPPRRTAARLAVQRFRANNFSSSMADDDLDDDIAPTVTEMDMLDEQELDEDDENEPTNVQTTTTKTISSPVKLPPPPPPVTKSTGGTIKSSYIGNMLPSFYEQLPESKKMLLQDATIDSSSNNSTNAETQTKTQIDIISPEKVKNDFHLISKLSLDFSFYCRNKSVSQPNISKVQVAKKLSTKKIVFNFVIQLLLNRINARVVIKIRNVIMKMTMTMINKHVNVLV